MKRDGVISALIVLIGVAFLAMSFHLSWQNTAALATEIDYSQQKGWAYDIPESTEVSTISSEINKARKQAGKAALKEHSLLGSVASKRVDDMLAGHYYAHADASGRTFIDQIRAQNVVSTGYACENLLLTRSTTPEVMVREWLESESHKSCLLNDDLRYLGISTALYDDAVSYSDDETTPVYVVVALHSEVIR